MELGLGPGKSWKVMENKPYGLLHFGPLYVLQNFGLHIFSILNSTLFHFDSTFWLDSTLKLNLHTQDYLLTYLLN